MRTSKRHGFLVELVPCGAKSTGCTYWVSRSSSTVQCYTSHRFNIKLPNFLPSTTLRLRGPTIARAGAHERHVNIATYIKEIESSGAITWKIGVGLDEWTRGSQGKIRCIWADDRIWLERIKIIDKLAFDAENGVNIVSLTMYNMPLESE